MRFAISPSVACLVTFTILLVLLLLIPLPSAGREWEAFTDFGHAPLFAVFAALLMGTLLRRRKGNLATVSILTWLGVVGFGMLSEAAQGPFGRHPSWHDVRTDALGAAIGILWTLGRSTESRRSRAGAFVACVLLTVVAAVEPCATFIDARRQRAEMPMLGSFENALEVSRWDTTGERVRRVKKHATDGEWAMQIHLRPEIDPAASFDHPYPDWSQYEAIAMDVFLEGASPLELTIRVEDGLHADAPPSDQPHDRFERTLRIFPGMQNVSIALADIAEGPRDRRLELERISAIHFFAPHSNESRTVFFDNIHLR